MDDRLEVERLLSTIATREDVRREGERLRAHMTACVKRVDRTLDALIDAIEFMKYNDSDCDRR
jgi:hypothetical protein